MEFCPKCGSVLMQKGKRSSCLRCNYTTKKECNLKTSEKIKEKEIVGIISQKDSEIHPVIEEKCKKCSNKKVYFWTMQTRSSDEAETKFFKCTKCEHLWREYH